MSARQALAHRMRRSPAPLHRRMLVSVVIPCHDYERYVGAAVESALSQTAVDIEVIVVDDCSHDGSVDVVAAIAARDERVRLITQPENRGAVVTFNTGLAVARGDYLVRLDADDLLTPGSLARAVAVAETYPSVGLVYGHPLHFSGDELPPPRQRTRRWSLWPGHEWLRDRCETGGNVITAPEALMRRSVVDVVGGQRRLAHTHDMEMWLRIAAVSDVAYVEGADQAWHREHEASLSQQVDAEVGDIGDRRDAFHTLFDWSGQHLADTPGLRALADRALAREAVDRIVHMHDRGHVNPTVVARLRAFAEDLDAAATTSPALRRAEQRGGDVTPRPWQVARALRRRLVNEARYRRWHHRGVFHRKHAA